MKKAILPSIIALLLLAATSAHAQVSVNVHVRIPGPVFPVVSPVPPPPLRAVVIRPRPVIVAPVVVARPVAVVRPVTVVRPVAVVRPVRRVVVVH